MNWLLAFTKEEREEETLKNLLANGVPPLPPKSSPTRTKVLLVGLETLAVAVATLTPFINKEIVVAFVATA